MSAEARNRMFFKRVQNELRQSVGDGPRVRIFAGFVMRLRQRAVCLAAAFMDDAPDAVAA